MLRFYPDTRRFSFRSVSHFFFFFWRFLLVLMQPHYATCGYESDIVSRVCVCALFGTCGTQHFISCQDGGRHTDRNETRGRIKQRSESMARQNANWNKKKTYIRSHCASNVITGSDTTMWHAALPICQSEIGRVTNGYHCYFPQPPPPPPPPILMSASCAEEEGWPKPGW